MEYHVHPRKPLRLRNYDYSQSNHYFVTICTWEKGCIFGQPGNLNEWGRIAGNQIREIPSYYEDVTIDHFVVMPNHVHMILVIGEKQKNITISQMISLYKAGVSREIRKMSPGFQVWQRSFYEHIIRNQQDYEAIWNYIENNPLKWEMDLFCMK